MSLLPFILFFIAAFFAPENATEIRISLNQKQETIFTRTEFGWSDKKMGEPVEYIWKIQDLSVAIRDDIINLSNSVSGITEHSWEALSILKLSGTGEVLKVKNGYWYYPKGINFPEDKSIITYQFK